MDSDANKAGESGWRETIKIVVHALILAMIVRIFFYQPFNIPSGSMKETLLVGDYLFVSKLSYGYSRYSFPFGIIPFNGRIFGAEPKRGDVVVFKLPRDNSTDFIKRVIGLPGDQIEVRGGIALHQRPGGAARSAWATSSRPEEDGRADPALRGDAAQRRQVLSCSTPSRTARSTTSAPTRCRPATTS